MSERMNKEKAIEILKKEKELCGGNKLREESKYFEEYIQALDIAIESLEEPHYKYLKCDKGVVYILNEWSDTDSLNCEKCRMEKLKEEFNLKRVDK